MLTWAIFILMHTGYRLIFVLLYKSLHVSRGDSRLWLNFIVIVGEKWQKSLVTKLNKQFSR